MSFEPVATATPCSYKVRVECRCKITHLRRGSLDLANIVSIVSKHEASGLKTADLANQWPLPDGPSGTLTCGALAFLLRWSYYRPKVGGYLVGGYSRKRSSAMEVVY
jgi:hypothetical protein